MVVDERQRAREMFAGRDGPVTSACPCTRRQGRFDVKQLVDLLHRWVQMESTDKSKSEIVVLTLTQPGISARCYVGSFGVGAADEHSPQLAPAGVVLLIDADTRQPNHSMAVTWALGGAMNRDHGIAILWHCWPGVTFKFRPSDLYCGAGATLAGAG
jgi:hypothetical protein